METPLPELPQQPSGAADDDHTLEKLAALTGLFDPTTLVEELRQLNELENEDAASGPSPEPPAGPVTS